MGVHGRLNHTAIVVLGMVAAGRSNGWQITQAVDRSTRFFWSASRGGIYPELRKLEAAGLVQAVDDPRGDVARHSYTLTPTGRAALDGWLTDATPGGFDLRSEDLLRLYFSGDLPTAERVTVIRHIRASHEEVLRQLLEIRSTVPSATATSSQTLVLDYGIALHTNAVNWCEDAERRLEDTTDTS